MSSTSAARRSFITLGALVALLATVPMARGAPQDTTSVRLAWDRNHDATIGYRVHVGTQPGAYDERYDVGFSTTFTYVSGVRGRRYYFAVSAYDAAGDVSPPSNEISIVIGDEAESAAATARVAASDSECCGARIRATALGVVSGLAALPDGRALFVENGRDVRILGVKGLVAAAALRADGMDTGFTEVVVDRRFTDTNFVFVGTTATRRDGRLDFHVVRYRLVLDMLGEGATVVSGLSYQGDHAPRFAVDNVGRIYVAMPGDVEDRSDPYAGRVLRFAADGSVPDDNRGGSPIFADGVAVPRDLDWDGRSIWIVGIDARSRPALAKLTLDASDGSWPRQLTDADFRIDRDVEVSAFDANGSSGSDQGLQRVAMLDTTHRLHRMTIRDLDGIVASDAMAWSADALPVDVVFGASGSILVVLQTATGSFALVEVVQP